MRRQARLHGAEALARRTRPTAARHNPAGPPGAAPPLTGARRLAAFLEGGEGVGPWPDRADAQRWKPDPAAVRTKRPSSRLSGDLIALAIRLSATASATFARMGLGSIEARVLTTLAESPQTSAQISKVIGVDRAAVCRSVQALMDRDLVTKLDGRARLISLTGSGQALIADIDRVSCAREQRLFAGFSELERTAVLAFLGRLMLNVPDLIELAESGVFRSMPS